MVRRGVKRPENQVRRFPVEEVPRSGIGGGERSETISRMFIMIQEGISRNAGSFLRKELGEALRIGPKNLAKN